jgi:hypothetical protein
MGRSGFAPDAGHQGPEPSNARRDQRVAGAEEEAGLAPEGVWMPGCEQLLALQRLAGNRAVTAVIQREAAVTASPDDAWIEAVNYVNKNSTVRLKFTGKPVVPSTGTIEMKAMTVLVEGTTEISAPWLFSSRAPVKAAPGTRAKADTEKGRDGAATTTAARVWASELQAVIPMVAETKLRDLVKFKATGEYVHNKEVKAGGGVMFDSDYVSGEKTFRFIDINLNAKNPRDIIKPMSLQLQLTSGTRLLEHKWPGALQAAGKSFDLKVRVKIGGIVEIGPTLEALESGILKFMGLGAAERFRAAVAETIAREEATMAIGVLSDKIAAEATDGISDQLLREYARVHARERAVAEAEKAGVKGSLVDVMMREALTGAAKTDLTAARMAMRKGADAAVREAFAATGRSVVREAVKDAFKLSGKRIFAAIGAALMVGPVDVALIGLEMLGHVVSDALVSADVMDVGMIARLARANYVAGYRDGLVGKGGGAAQPAGRASAEGAALSAGLSDGTRQFTKVVDAALTDRPELASGLITRAEIVAEVRELTATMAIDESRIVAQAVPRLEKMMIDAYVKAHTGLLDQLFGSDPRDTADFESFLRNVRSNLATNKIEYANLANGVRLRVVALDRTAENARRFRTADGVRIVRLGGETTNKRSGWITLDGQPLEELYTNEAVAEGANSGGPEFERKMGELLAASALRLTVRFDGSSMRTEGLMVFGPGGSSPEFVHYLRTAGALNRTVGSFATVTVSSTYLPSGGHPGSLFIHKRGSGIAGGDRAGDGNANLRRFARQLGLTAEGPGLADAVARHLYGTHLASARLSAFPIATASPAH